MDLHPAQYPVSVLKLSDLSLALPLRELYEDTDGALVRGSLAPVRCHLAACKERVLPPGSKLLRRANTYFFNISA